MIVIFKCLNSLCRIVTFNGVNLIPLNNCPGCQSAGILDVSDVELSA